MSWWSREEDDPTFSSYYLAPGTEDLKYSEGVFVGYRAYGKGENKPEFPFGFGLSYTTFAFRHLTVTPGAAGGMRPSKLLSRLPTPAPRAGAGSG